jgi:hypothetical protein
MPKTVIILLFIVLCIIAFSSRARAEFQKHMDHYHNIVNAEIGTASWMKTTGLSNETEAELIRYLRRELGVASVTIETDIPNLEASHLNYLGVFTEGNRRVHYWTVIWDKYKEGDVYATVETDLSGKDEILSVSDQKPPTQR